MTNIWKNDIIFIIICKGEVIVDVSKIKEELSISYIATVAALAGIDYQIDCYDGDSTDGT